MSSIWDPLWAVLSPRMPVDIELRLRRRIGLDDDEAFPCWTETGTRGYTTLAGYEPGLPGLSEQAIALELSRYTSTPTYLLQMHDYYEHVDAFLNGIELGVVAVYPTTVAEALGCRLSAKHAWPTASGDVDLTPHPWPASTPGEPTLSGMTIAQWQHMMSYERDWSALLDGVEEGAAAYLDPWLDEPGPGRLVAIRLVRELGVHGLGRHAESLLARLAALAAEDPMVRDEANETVAELRELFYPRRAE